MIGEEKLKQCIKDINDIAIILDKLAHKRYNSYLIVTSGKRNGTGRSWHNSGRAIDFVFNNVNVFKITTEIFNFCLYNHDVFSRVTEFEVCRGKGKQHIHLACGNEPRLESFTGIYR